VAPRRLVHDLHPDYASTRYALSRARETGVELLAVQHHHAHLASCMAEHGLAETVLGVTFDGTGLGTDGTLWGGEFLLGDARAVRRAAHLASVPMPGGAQAAREPWRMAVAHLVRAGVPVATTPLAQRIAPQALRAVEAMAARGVNAPETSSAGRLFDAVAALAGVCDRASFEGMAAMALEAAAARTTPDGRYAFDLEDAGETLVVQCGGLIREVAHDARRGVAADAIAARFHATLADAIAAVCARLRASSAVGAVVLSGGVFVNAVLLQATVGNLRAMGFRVYTHARVPPNDGGLSLGQLAIAAARDAAQGA
jgi:hydrogenase maturation protein HypF